MRDDVVHLRHLAAQGVDDGVRDAVRVFDSHGAVDLDVDVHEIAEADFHHPQFFDAPHLGHGAGDPAHLREEFGRRRAIHVFVERLAEERNAIVTDHEAPDEGADVVRFLVTRPADQRHDDAEKRRRGRDRVRTVMPCVALERRARSLVAFFQGVTREQFLGHDHQQKHGKREPRGRRMPLEKIARALVGDRAARSEKRHRREKRAQLLGLAVSVRMIPVRRLGREFQRNEHDGGRHDVVDRLDAVRHQRIGMTDDSRDNLHCRERSIHKDALERGANGGGDWLGHQEPVFFPTPD